MTTGACSSLMNGSLCIWFCLDFLRRRFVAVVYLNIGVMRGAAFFPVIPYLLADKRIRKFAPDIASRADFIPPGQYFFHFHHRLLSSGSLWLLDEGLQTICHAIWDFSWFTIQESLVLKEGATKLTVQCLESWPYTIKLLPNISICQELMPCK